MMDKPIEIMLKTVDTTDLACVYLKQLKQILDGIVEITKENKTAHGLACVGAGLAELHCEEFLNIAYEFQQKFDAMKGGA